MGQLANISDYVGRREVIFMDSNISVYTQLWDVHGFAANLHCLNCGFIRLEGL